MASQCRQKELNWNGCTETNHNKYFPYTDHRNCGVMQLTGSNNEFELSLGTLGMIFNTPLLRCQNHTTVGMVSATAACHSSIQLLRSGRKAWVWFSSKGSFQISQWGTSGLRYPPPQIFSCIFFLREKEEIAQWHKKVCTQKKRTHIPFTGVRRREFPLLSW